MSEPTECYAIIGTQPLNAVLAVLHGDMWYPMVTLKRELVPAMVKSAKELSVPFKVWRFSQAEDVTENWP